MWEVEITLRTKMMEDGRWKMEDGRESLVIVYRIPRIYHPHQEVDGIIRITQQYNNNSPVAPHLVQTKRYRPACSSIPVLVDDIQYRTCLQAFRHIAVLVVHMPFMHVALDHTRILCPHLNNVQDKWML